jgi:hypothetical protein
MSRSRRLAVRLMTALSIALLVIGLVLVAPASQAYAGTCVSDCACIETAWPCGGGCNGSGCGSCSCIIWPTGCLCV